VFVVVMLFFVLHAVILVFIYSDSYLAGMLPSSRQHLSYACLKVRHPVDAICNWTFI